MKCYRFEEGIFLCLQVGADLCWGWEHRNSYSLFCWVWCWRRGWRDPTRSKLARDRSGAWVCTRRMSSILTKINKIRSIRDSKIFSRNLSPPLSVNWWKIHCSSVSSRCFWSSRIRNISVTWEIESRLYEDEDLTMHRQDSSYEIETYIYNLCNTRGLQRFPVLGDIKQK